MFLDTSSKSLKKWVPFPALIVCLINFISNILSVDTVIWASTQIEKLRRRGGGIQGKI